MTSIEMNFLSNLKNKCVNILSHSNMEFSGILTAFDDRVFILDETRLVQRGPGMYITERIEINFYPRPYKWSLL